MPRDERSSAHRGPVNVLVVDDRAENRLALRAILSSSDYRLVEAASSFDALRHLLETEFAVLLIDVVMPGIDGFELARRIKERERTANVPIVFMTAQSADARQVFEGYGAGAVDYLIKPLVPEVVRAKVAVFVELHRQRLRIEEQSVALLEAQRRDNEHRLVDLRLAGERRYRSLAEAVPHIVWTADALGVVDYFNQRWYAYTGAAMPVTGGSWESAVHEEERGKVQEAWAIARATGEMLEIECRLRSATGEHRWHLCRAVPERSPSGQIVSWLGTFTDVEDQKRAHQALLEFKATLDAVNDAVVIFDPSDGRFLYANHGVSVLTGYSQEELKEKRPSDFSTDHDMESLRELVAPLGLGTTDSTTSTKFETQVKRRDGRMIPVEVSLQLIPISGGRIIGLARDITDRKRAQLERELLYQEAVNAIRTRDDFISVAAHELKTPISALQMQFDLLVKSNGSKEGVAAELFPGAPEKGDKRLKMVARQVERLGRLTTQLMDVTKITSGRLELALEDADLTEIVRDVVLRLGEEASRVQCAIAVTTESPVRGRWDRLRLEQVITNLLTNAFKFGAGKPIEVSVTERAKLARITIADHGAGIAPEDIERIFKRYEQAQSARAHGGLGLGLYIVRQIVESHGGTVRVDSKQGVGSVFTVEVPREPVPVTRRTIPPVPDDDESGERALDLETAPDSEGEPGRASRAE